MSVVRSSLFVHRVTMTEMMAGVKQERLQLGQRCWREFFEEHTDKLNFSSGLLFLLYFLNFRVA